MSLPPRFLVALTLLLLGCVAPSPGAAPEPGVRAYPDPAGAARPQPTSPPSAAPGGVDGSHSGGDPYYPRAGNGGYDVLHYAIRLEVDVEGGSVDAETTVAALATEDLRSFSLDLHGLEVLSVVVDGAEAAFDREGDELVVRPRATLRAGVPFVCRVAYGGTPEAVPDPGVPFVPGVGWWPTEEGIYVLSECIGAPSWFPCNDVPHDKASFTIEVTVPEPWVAAANGRLVEEREADGERTYRFSAPDPMSTYLATVNVARFERRFETTPAGLPLATYYPEDATDEELAAFDRTAEMIEVFEERFGPYPFESFGAVLAYRQLGGALETQTLPVYGRGASEPVVAHELAHQWFGDCVGPADWRDLWLNEGFASYAEWLWLEYDQGPEALAERARGMHERVFRRKVGSPADPGVEELFGARTYARGAVVLHALRGELGDGPFFALLRAWVARYHGGVASTADFVRCAEDVAGRDLTEFFDAWLYADVVPAPEPAPAAAPADGGGR